MLALTQWGPTVYYPCRTLLFSLNITKLKIFIKICFHKKTVLWARIHIRGTATFSLLQLFSITSLKTQSSLYLIPLFVLLFLSYDPYSKKSNFRNSIPGEPGVDYPIFPSVGDSAFSCDGLVFGGWNIFLFTLFITSLGRDSRLISSDHLKHHLLVMGCETLTDIRQSNIQQTTNPLITRPNCA